MWTERKLKNLADKILKLLKIRGATLDVFLLKHAEIKKLKARFIKPATSDKRQATRMAEPNVLSFPEPVDFPHPERRQATSDKRQERNVSPLSSRRRPGSMLPARKYLGEIYLNKDILRKSPDRAIPLLLHGMLHLLGYDHIKRADAVIMEGEEVGILRDLAPKNRTAKRR